MKTITKITLTSIAALCLGALAPQQAAAQTDNSSATDGLRIATGKRGKGYSKLFADLKAVCGPYIQMSEVETEGGLQNLSALSANNAELGFVQIDTLQEMKTSDEAIGTLQALIPLNSNLLHILANRQDFVQVGEKRLAGMWPGEKTIITVAKFSDLKGLPVAVVGSARSLGRVLDRRFAMSMKFVDVETDEQGMRMLQSGEVAGMLSTSGWPSGPIQKLKRNSDLRLLPFDLTVQSPYHLVRKNYENIDTFNHQFLASPNVLVTRPFSGSGPYGRAVTALQSCIQKNLVMLQEGPFEPAWREVRITRDDIGWPRFAAAGKR